MLHSGRLFAALRRIPRDEDLATKKAIYSTLKQKLQTQKTRKKGIFDVFLRQLAELVWAHRDVQDLTNGQALYRALKRLP